MQHFFFCFFQPHSTANQAKTKNQTKLYTHSMASVRVSFVLNGNTVQADLLSKALGHSPDEMGGSKAVIKLLDPHARWIYGTDKFTVEGFKILPYEGAKDPIFVGQSSFTRSQVPYIRAIRLSESICMLPQTFVSVLELPISSVTQKE